MIYLASPYSHPDPLVRQARFEAACHAAVKLIRAGQPVFSPIVNGHPLVQLGLPTDWSFWQRFDEEHLKRCDELIVLQLVGWRESEGVREEVGMATELGKPIHYLPAEIDGSSLSSHHAQPEAHVSQTAAGGPVGRILAPTPTSGVLGDEAARRANA